MHMGQPPNVTALASLLGLAYDAPAVRLVLGGLGSMPEVEAGEESEYLEYKDLGIQVGLQEESYLRANKTTFRPEGRFVVVAVHLYSRGLEGYSEYPGELPGSVKFRAPRDLVRQVLGTPNAEGGGNFAVKRFWPLWDRYDRDAYSMRFQYDAGKKLEQVTFFRVNV